MSVVWDWSYATCLVITVNMLTAGHRTPDTANDFIFRPMTISEILKKTLKIAQFELAIYGPCHNPQCFQYHVMSLHGNVSVALALRLSYNRFHRLETTRAQSAVCLSQWKLSAVVHGYCLHLLATVQTSSRQQSRPWGPPGYGETWEQQRHLPPSPPKKI